jgi:carbamoyl-phosphate synthase large subunit
VRPSYVLGGRSMRVCYDQDEVVQAFVDTGSRRLLVDRFLENAIELDVDALCDGRDTYVAAVMEHVEEAGIHSGDSSCVLPAPSDSDEVREAVRRLGRALGVVGLLNVQLALAAGELYVLEVNPRASRTVPVASKATGVNLVDAACRLAAGATIASLRLPGTEAQWTGGYHVKAAVLPFARFPGADPVLGPEMRSTGEVMASAADFPTAFAKAERAAGRALPGGGRAFLSVRDHDKLGVVPIARALKALGFALVATEGTGRALELAGVEVERVDKGDPVVALVRSGGVDVVVNTPEGRNARRDGYAIREAAVVARVPCITTLAVARAAVDAIAKARAESMLSLQERHEARAS